MDNQKNKTNDTLYKIYSYLDNVTPLKYDCGKLCNKKCCRGTDSDGMILFPGEKDLFENNKNFNVYFDVQYQMYAVRCKGYCNRSERPLSCRIFPYMIYMENNKATVAEDIRAIDFCPVLIDNHSLNKQFLRSLRISALKMTYDKIFSEFLRKLTLLLTDFNSL